MTIRILPESLVNRIAAGEVVERPASVVKELVENALDAGATAIEVVIEDAGKNLIIVQDNGKGMSREELTLSVARHATSKLPGDDLLNIRHFGFRGEALPSIASVSRMKIATRRAADAHGWSLLLDGGKPQEVIPATMLPGTRIEVRDLFYTTPARLNFLKSDRSEAGSVHEVMRKFAMVHPQVAFKFSSGGKTLLNVAASASAQARIADVMGREFAENSLALAHERGTLTLSGFASLPTYNMGNSTSQYLFVNGRQVRDKLLLGVVKAAYQDVLAHDRYAVVVLFVQLPAEDVDVNVHPAKAEVRFRDAQALRGLIIGAIRNAIGEAGFRASKEVAAEALARFSAPEQQYSAPLFNTAVTTQSSAGFYEHRSGYGAPPAHTLVPQARATEAPAMAADGVSYPLGAARTQLHKTYIVAETPSGLVIVDQHAAHERLVYEKMKKAMAEKGIARQVLLIPEVVELEAVAAEAILARAAEFAELGLIIEPFGGHSVVVRETPALLGEVNVVALITALADDLTEYDEAMSLADKLQHVCGTMACHSSIRAGRELNIAEMNALLREMEHTPSSGQCNHGRPTYIELKRKDIEILFGRRG
ncbi:MAG: DNA mismatch repair endonuclease MutL [Alphaproteobacteria bacterium]|nr:DNA mismatch repair endonuclease MutL [Alphaproteobacteria bacterium]